jgi:hypothetical protein
MASKRGFAAMSLEKRRAIAAKGGRSSRGGRSRTTIRSVSTRGGTRTRMTRTTRGR